MNEPPSPRVLSDSEGTPALERAARSTYELRADRCLNDVEWKKARSRLVDFAVILRAWNRNAKKPQTELGNVDAICQRET